jgi:hypothetical protein
MQLNNKHQHTVEKKAYTAYGFQQRKHEDSVHRHTDKLLLFARYRPRKPMRSGCGFHVTGVHTKIDVETEQGFFQPRYGFFCLPGSQNGNVESSLTFFFYIGHYTIPCFFVSQEDLIEIASETRYPPR